jgi:peptide/nickel transport system substrate-binding protein
MMLLCGCQTNLDSYTPTGDGLTWEDGQQAGNNQTESQQELTLIYYPNKTLNPLKCTDFTNRALLPLMYQGLFATDRDYEVHPILCKSYRVSQDMKTYTFYLENATFSDGTALTVADVVATLEAARISAYYAGRFQHINTVTAGEDGSVVVTLDTPMENLPILLDIPIVKAGELELARPLGTGPYYLDTAGGASLLRRRTGWWCNPAMVVTAPAIALKEAVDNPQIRDSFEFDSLDLVCADPGSDRYADYRCDFELWDSENGIFLYLICNMESEIFSNAKIRAALTTAIDRDTLVAAEYRGFARSASLPASPDSPYYSQVLAEKYAYDGTGETLKNAVADARLTDAPLVLMVNSGDSLRVRQAYAIGEMLTNAGFKVTVSECSESTYKKNLKNRNYDLCLAQTKLSPNMDLSPFFSSSGSLNYGKISDTAMYALCKEALANHGNYYTLHQTVMNDGRLCPILFRSYAVYATRGLLTELTPARDNIFFYSLGKTMDSALLK